MRRSQEDCVCVHIPTFQDKTKERSIWVWTCPCPPPSILVDHEGDDCHHKGQRSPQRKCHGRPLVGEHTHAERMWPDSEGMNILTLEVWNTILYFSYISLLSPSQRIWATYHSHMEALKLYVPHHQSFFCLFFCLFLMSISCFKTVSSAEVMWLVVCLEVDICIYIYICEGRAWQSQDYFCFLSYNLPVFSLESRNNIFFTSIICPL